MRWYQQVTAILNSDLEKGNSSTWVSGIEKHPCNVFREAETLFSIQRAECPCPAVNVLAAVETFNKIYFQQLNAMCENWAFHRET